MSFRLIFTVFVLFLIHSYSAQTKFQDLETSPPNPLNAPLFQIDKKAGHSYSVFIIKDSIKVLDIDMTEVLDVIVEFKRPPLFTEQFENNLQKLDVSAYHSEQVQFAGDISLIYNEVRNHYKAVQLTPPEIKREFYKLFNGASLTIPRAMIPFINNLEYIKRVQINKKYHANEEYFRDKRGAAVPSDLILETSGNQGDSIVVGIIDTGIDYLHPALGKGIGKEFKVKGGYDFVNKDNDPMDDNGHGTHVAGIVSADGDSIKGIAPKSFLMAFKVLDDMGYGLESDVMAAIERAVDPNEDNNFSDRVDIVNLSLGNSSGSYDDAVCKVVNNADKLGVVFCVSAGNDGDFYTIGTPGSAVSAITVGAIDNLDKLASFSSKGPVKKNYSVKPELLAPGVSIISTFPGGSYKSLSGTSMSTPYVAGICALIKKLHRNWTPEFVKSALVSTAADLGMEVMAQGAGKVNAAKSLSIQSFAVPSILSFGIDYANEQTWVKEDTLKITNYTQTDQHYNVSATGMQPGIELNIHPSDFMLHPGESRYIESKITVDNNLIPFSVKIPGTYSGKVVIRSSTEELDIPWAFVKTPALILKLEENFETYIIYNNDNFYSNWSGWNLDNPYVVELPVAPGNYNMFFSFPGISGFTELRKYVFRENIDINGFKVLQVDTKDAGNLIEIKGLDENGNELNTLDSETDMLFVLNRRPGMLITSSFLTHGDMKYYSSNFSKNISLFTGQFVNKIPDENKIRVIQFPEQKGLSGNILLKNNPGDFIRQNITINDGNKESDSKTAFLNVIHFRTGYYAVTSSSQWISGKRWIGTLYMSPDPDRDFGNSTFIHTGMNSFDSYWFRTSIFSTRGDSIGWFGNNINPRDVFIPDKETITLGDGAVYPFLNANIAAEGTNYKLDLYPRFYGQLKEERVSDMNNSIYSLYDSKDKLLINDKLSNPLSVTLPSGKYKYEIKNNNYTVCNKEGNAILSSIFEISHINIPTLTSLRILNSKGIPVSNLFQGEKVKISFSVKSSVSDFPEVKLFFKTGTSAEWQTVKTDKVSYDTLAGYIFSSEAGNMSEKDSSDIDLKIIAGDKYNNSTEWVLIPAFYVGNYVYTGNESQKSPVPLIFELKNNYPNPFNPVTIISYSLPEMAYVELKVFDLLGREMSTLVDKEQNAGQYKIQFNGGNLSSGIYICRFKAGHFIKANKIILLK